MQIGHRRGTHRVVHPHPASLRRGRPRRALGTQHGGFRLYTDDDVDRLNTIRRMKPLGFTLDEMRQLLDSLDTLADDSADPAGQELSIRLRHRMPHPSRSQLRDVATSARIRPGVQNPTGCHGLACDPITVKLTSRDQTSGDKVASVAPHAGFISNCRGTPRDLSPPDGADLNTLGRSRGGACLPAGAGQAWSRCPLRARGVPQIVIIRVDLPAPFEPISVTISPCCTSRSMPRKRLDLAIEGLDAADGEEGVAHRLPSSRPAVFCRRRQLASATAADGASTPLPSSSSTPR